MLWLLCKALRFDWKIVTLKVPIERSWAWRWSAFQTSQSRLSHRRRTFGHQSLLSCISCFICKCRNGSWFLVIVGFVEPFELDALTIDHQIRQFFGDLTILLFLRAFFGKSGGVNKNWSPMGSGRVLKGTYWGWDGQSSRTLRRGRGCSCHLLQMLLYALLVLLKREILFGHLIYNVKHSFFSWKKKTTAILLSRFESIN